jgi:glycosyltransferase involved in cell wall biosynthesis
MSYSRRMRAFVTFAIRSARLARSIDCDIIFATSTPLTIAIPAMYAAWRRRVPWVLEVRDLWPEVPIAVGALRNPVLKAAASALARASYSSARHIVALSPGMKDGIVARGVPAEKVAVIPNCSDVDRFDPNWADPRRFIARFPQLAGRRLAIYAGQIGKINSLEYVVDMAAETLRVMPELAFVMLGCGSERARLEAYARSRGVWGTSLFFIDPVPKEEMTHVFAAADIALGIFKNVPHMDTNSSNKFFDALAAGKPVAINYGGWQADLIRAHELGLVFEGIPAVTAASHLVSYLSDKHLNGQASYRCLRLARACFDIAAMARALEDVLMARCDRPDVQQHVDR